MPMTIPQVPCYPNDTPDQLRARITNYEEAMGEALPAIQADPALAAMFQGVLALGGAEHLQILRQFEAIMGAVIAFKDRVLTEAAKDQCPLCKEVGTHTPDCLLAAALRIHPHLLEKVEAPALAQLMLLQQKIKELVQTADTPAHAAVLHGLLQDFPAPGGDASSC